MCETSETATLEPASKDQKDHSFVVLCSSGFEAPQRMRSALMFATLAASAEMDTILYCVQGAVEVMVKGAIEEHEVPEPGSPTLKDRLEEAMALGVKVQCCTQTMKNKKIETKDLVEGVEPAGAMSLINIATDAQGTLSF